MASERLLWIFLVILAIAECISAGRLKRLEDRMDVLAVRIDSESRFRREDMRTLFSQIENIAEALNRSEVQVSCQHQQKYDRKDTVSKSSSSEITKVCTNWRTDFKQLSLAFKDEKLFNRNFNDRLSHTVDQVKATEAAMEIIGDSLDDVSGNINNVADNVQAVLNKTNENQKKLSELAQEMHQLKSQFVEIKEICSTTYERPKSCLDLYVEMGKRVSGQYDVYPDGRETPIRVFCDQETDLGGWMVFQRREDGSENFYRGWLDYKFGFGHLNGEFWLGNEYLSILTSTGSHQLRIDMESFEGEKKYAIYEEFQVKDKNEKYMLKVKGYSGNAGDSLKIHNGYKFSTKDRDNDGHQSNCAETYKGAWWYERCHSSNLNGQYLGGKHSSYADGVNWRKWKGYHYSLKFTEMKFR